MNRPLLRAALIAGLVLSACGGSRQALEIKLPPEFDEAYPEGRYNALVSAMVSMELEDVMAACLAEHPASLVNVQTTPPLSVTAQFDADGRQTALVAQRGREPHKSFDAAFEASAAFQCMLQRFSNMRAESRKRTNFSHGIEVHSLARDEVGPRRGVVDAMVADAERTCPRSPEPVGWTVAFKTRVNRQRFEAQQVDPAIAACLHKVVERADLTPFSGISGMREWVVVPFFVRQKLLYREGSAAQ